MILVLGAGTYIGRSFCAELRHRGHDYLLPAERDYADFHALFDCVRKSKPRFLINAAGRSGAEVDLNEGTREEMLRSNTILPRFIAQVCLLTNTPWGHVSSCEIYSGAKVVVAAGIVVGKKLYRAALLRLIAKTPEKLRGFTEADEPNFSFRAAPCSFFSGTMALAEEAIRGIGRNYIWRMGRPFNERDERENFLHSIRNSEKICDGVNVLSHTEDFVRACLDLWERQSPFGIYNVGNPGVVTVRQIAEMDRRIIPSPRHVEFWPDDEETHSMGGRVLRSDCILDVSKLLATGATMRPALEAIEDSLKNWRPDISHVELHGAAA